MPHQAHQHAICNLRSTVVRQRSRRRLRARARPQAKKAGDLGDEDFLRLAAEDAELKRARERLTLKHRNSSQWARRALKRGLTVMDPGAPPALAAAPCVSGPLCSCCCALAVIGRCWHAF